MCVDVEQVAASVVARGVLAAAAAGCAALLTGALIVT
jgi:hypothetical protein